MSVFPFSIKIISFTKANAFGNDLTKVQICDLTKCAKISWDEKLNVTTD